MYSSYSKFSGSPEFLLAYRTVYQSLRRRKNKSRPSKRRAYRPESQITTQEASNVFVPLFYAGEKDALGIWDKEVGIGSVKRRLDEETRSYHVLDITTPISTSSTYISTPSSTLQALHITLPHMVMVMNYYRRNFAFEVLIMDSKAHRRRFSFATWYNPAVLKRYPLRCQIPLRLQLGWNEIHVDLRDLVKRAYKTSYVETLRIMVYANCQLRQIFFCDDRMIKGSVAVPSMRDFSNLRLLANAKSNRKIHPNTYEHGPGRPQLHRWYEPPEQMSSSRLQRDLIHLTRKRFYEMPRNKLGHQPYKTYFRELILEDRLTKQIQEKIQFALRVEAKRKALHDWNGFGNHEAISHDSFPPLIAANELPADEDDIIESNNNETGEQPENAEKEEAAAGIDWGRLAMVDSNKNFGSSSLPRLTN